MVKLTDITTTVEAEAIIRSIIKGLELNFLLKETDYTYDEDSILLNNMSIAKNYKYSKDVLDTVILRSVMTCNGYKSKAKILNLSFNIYVTLVHDFKDIGINFLPGGNINKGESLTFTLNERVVFRHYDYFKLQLL